MGIGFFCQLYDILQLDLHPNHSLDSSYYFMIFLHPVLFLVINCLDQVYIVESIDNLWIRRNRSSDKLLDHLRDFEVVVF